MIPPTIDAWLASPRLPHPLADQALLVSPELALVDDELRRDAIALLPEVRPFAFLELREEAPAEPEWFYLEPLAEYRRPEPKRPSLAVAAGAYLAAAILRTVAFNVVVFAGISLLVLVLNLAA